ncbi:MAG: hypothetical protein PVTTEEND_001189 [Candidatus Fervidibacter sp.]
MKIASRSVAALRRRRQANQHKAIVSVTEAREGFAPVRFGRKIAASFVGQLVGGKRRGGGIFASDEGGVQLSPILHGASTQRRGDGDGTAGSSALAQAPWRLTEEAAKLTDEIGELAVADKEGDVCKAQLRRLHQTAGEVQPQAGEVADRRRAQMLTKEPTQVGRTDTAVLRQAGQVERAFKGVVQPLNRPLQRQGQSRPLRRKQIVHLRLEGEGLPLRQQAEERQQQPFGAQRGFARGSSKGVRPKATQIPQRWVQDGIVDAFEVLMGR